jgi:hypothetical protein
MGLGRQVCSDIGDGRAECSVAGRVLPPQGPVCGADRRSGLRPSLKRTLIHYISVVRSLRKRRLRAVVGTYVVVMRWR